MKKIFLTVFFMFSFILLCSCKSNPDTMSHLTSDSMNNDPGTEEVETASPIKINSGISLECSYSYDVLSQACNSKPIRSMYWLSDNEILIECYDYEHTETDVNFDVVWLVWNLKENTFYTLYEFETKSCQPISALYQTGDILQVTSFGGEHRTIDLKTKKAVAEENESTGVLDPLTTFYDFETNTLFYFEDGQIWKSSNGQKIPLCQVTNNDYPHSLTLSPDKKTFAFSSVYHDAWVREIVLIDLETLEISRIEKEMTMPYLCWIDNQLCCIENTEYGITYFYYGPTLDVAMELTFPNPAEFYVRFNSGLYNLGAQGNKIPMTQEYRNENGKWIAELYLLSAEDGILTKELLLSADNQNITSAILSPDGSKIMITYFKAFDGASNTVSVYSIQS